MRWWLQTDPPKLFAVDNASVKGMDYSALDPDLYMVQWTDGKGEIEYQVDADTNDNGLREDFYDVTPYVPYFKQFLQRVPLLTLDQAKKVQVDLIKMLYESKRQIPYHYIIAAGDYWWDTSDVTMFSAMIPTMQNIITTANATVDRVNTLSSNTGAADQSLVTAVNGMIAQVNARIVTTGNAMTDQVNGRIVTPGNTMTDQVNARIVTPGTLSIDHLNNSVIGFWDHVPGNNTLNNRLQEADGCPGLTNNVPKVNESYKPSGIDHWSVAVDYWAFAIDSISLSGTSYPPLDHVSSTNVQWIPYGSSVPVTVTPSEANAIIQGIVARTNQLNLIKNGKIAEVNALTTIQAVIDYDVLAGWPIIPAPPGFRLEAPIIPPSGGITVVGTPGTATEGVPEAPSDGVTYGRRNMAWNPALALSGDTLDGGNF